MMAYLSFGEKGIENFDNFSTIEQTEVYSYVMSIFASEDKQFDQWKLTSEYLTKLEKSSDPIPQNVMNFMKEVLWYAAENTWTAVWKGLQFFAWVAVDNPRLAAILWAMNIPIIPDRSSMADIVFF